MSFGDSEIQEIQRKNMYLEAENKQLHEELDQYKTQMQQYKHVNDSLQQALKEKDSLLEQLKQVNTSLEEDIKLQKAFKNKGAASAFSGLHPWSEGGVPGGEPEQFRKLFVGGLDYNTKEDGLREHFSQYGEVDHAAIIYDKERKESRGFGFVIFKSAAMVDAAQEGRPHTVDGRHVDTKRALPREDTEQGQTGQSKKLFVGGFNRETEVRQVEDYFRTFGNMERVEMLMHKDTGKSRGFAFVYFDDHDTVDKLVLIKHHVINGARCQVKKAVPVDRRSRSNHPGNQGGTGNQDMNSANQGNYGGPGNYNQGNYQNQGNVGNQGNYGGQGNDGGPGSFGSQGNYGNQSGYSNQGSYSSQGNYGSPGNQGSYGGSPGNYGGNQGNYGGSQGNYGGSQGNYGGSQGNTGNPGNPGNQGGGNSQEIPPPMMAMMTAFYNQYMGSQTGSGGAGPVRNTGNRQNRGGGPYNASTNGLNAETQNTGPTSMITN